MCWNAMVVSPICHPAPPGGLSHLSDSSSYLLDTLESDEKKDESQLLASCFRFLSLLRSKTQMLPGTTITD